MRRSPSSASRRRPVSAPSAIPSLPTSSGGRPLVFRPVGPHWRARLCAERLRSPRRRRHSFLKRRGCRSLPSARAGLLTARALAQSFLGDVVRRISLVRAAAAVDFKHARGPALSARVIAQIHRPSLPRAASRCRKAYCLATHPRLLTTGASQCLATNCRTCLRYSTLFATARSIRC